MLLEISADVARHASMNDEAKMAIENILRSAREGRHVVVSDLATLNLLEESSWLNSSEKGTVSKIRSKWAELSGLRHILAPYLIIHTSCDDSNQNAPKVSYRHFLESISTQKTVLLGENSSDVEVVYELAKLLLLKKRWIFELSAERHGGGGDTVHEEITSFATEGRFLLCFTDGDKKHESSPYGDTAKKAIAAANSLLAFQRLYIFECKSIENILPAPLIKNATQNVDGGQYIRSFASSCIRWEDTAARYIDTRKGLTCFELRNELGEKSPFSKIRRSHSSDCGDCTDSKACSTKVFPGLKDLLGYVERFLKYLPQDRAAEAADWLDDAPDELLAALSLTVAWCCSYPRYVT